ncbi:hypothetical protein I553_4543 [Mycobacterium xenopi 4042]|uniref:Uncharacterized protein n=1 Tax=Mycobacterium xenopi 4042 TaxID=1299334 RepID=X8AGP0_MYCXE|nr:hypothetical protein I553_4543 [Mycobacterium xenopi 4042]
MNYLEDLSVSWFHRPPSYSNPDAAASDSLARSLWRIDSDCQQGRNCGLTCDAGTEKRYFSTEYEVSTSASRQIAYQ